MEDRDPEDERLAAYLAGRAFIRDHAREVYWIEGDDTPHTNIPHTGCIVADPCLACEIEQEALRQADGGDLGVV